MPPKVRTDVPDSEARMGLGFYLTQTPGIGGSLRVTPEDFQVHEDPGTVSLAEGKGKYTLAKVQARNWETNRLIRQIAKQLGISERRIFFSGTKDKRAVTVQNIAIPVDEPTVQALSLGDVDILETTRVDRAPKLGEHSGNAFVIRIREMDVDLDEAEARARAMAETILDTGGFPNFFGPQRFGSVRPITHDVGRALVHDDPLEAVWTYIAKPDPLDPPELAEPRQHLWETRDPEEGLELLPRRLDYERMMLDQLTKTPDDGVAALERLPRTLQTLFIAAYQSLLFNRALTKRIAQAPGHRARLGDILHPIQEDGTPDSGEAIPVHDGNLDRCQEACRRGWGLPTGALPGYDESHLASGLQGELEREALAEEELAPDDFRIYEAPHLSSSGTRRTLWCPIDRLEVDAGTDGVGDHIELSFFLPKGSYATCLLREIMKTDVPGYT